VAPRNGKRNSYVCPLESRIIEEVGNTEVVMARSGSRARLLLVSVVVVAGGLIGLRVGTGADGVTAGSLQPSGTAPTVAPAPVAGQPVLAAYTRTIAAGSARFGINEVITTPDGN
jgi:hypothetical protein